jgi:hypothetical protein
MSLNVGQTHDEALRKGRNALLTEREILGRKDSLDSNRSFMRFLFSETGDGKGIGRLYHLKHIMNDYLVDTMSDIDDAASSQPSFQHMMTEFPSAEKSSGGLRSFVCDSTDKIDKAETHKPEVETSATELLEFSPVVCSRNYLDPGFGHVAGKNDRKTAYSFDSILESSTAPTAPQSTLFSATRGSGSAVEVPKDDGSSIVNVSGKNTWFLESLRGPPTNYGLDDPDFAGHNGECGLAS